MGLLDSTISSLINYGATESTNKTNVRLWREQANYNTPANQMARLKAAGLNPNLVYGSMGNTMSSPPTTQAPRVDISGLSEDVSRYYDIKNMDAQNELLKAQLKQSEAQTKGILIDNNFKALGLDKAPWYMRMFGSPRVQSGLDKIVSRIVKAPPSDYSPALAPEVKKFVKSDNPDWKGYQKVISKIKSTKTPAGVKDRF
nr:MAG: DNA pilot protein [Microvirus sp.]